MSRTRSSRPAEQTDGQSDVLTDETDADAASPPDEGTPSPSVSLRRKPKVRKSRPESGRKRCTVELTEELDQIITWIAARCKIDKYDLVYNVVLAGMKRYDEYEACEKFWNETMCQSVRVA